MTEKTGDAGGKKALRLAATWIATWALLLLPDLLLYWGGYPVLAAVKLKAWLTAGIIALLLSTARSRRFRMWAVALLVVNQAIWTGYVVYFGEALRPEHLLVFREETTDTAIGALAEWRTFLPWFVTLALSATLLASLQWREAGGTRFGWRVSGWAFAVAIAAVTVAWMVHPRIDAAFPGKHSGSIYGPYQAAIGAIRLGMTQVAAASLNVRAQTQSQAPRAAEPVTVVVIMGESINPTRLSLYGFKSDTTPTLAQWRTTPPAGFTFIPEIGFSGGLDTYASVPTFLRAAYWPVRSERFGVNLFELAHRQNFKSWVLSAQTANFIEAAGGAPHAEAIEFLANDGAMAKRAAALPDRGEDSFIFLHQRANHAPYTSSCASVPDGHAVFSPPTDSTEDQRRTAYDNGLWCWDQDVAALAAPFLKRRGAVHIFIMADHSEIMGEDGHWGHGFTDLRVAMVPMMLLTNRPDSDVAALFKSWSPPDAYRIGQTVALAFGVHLDTPNIGADRFFINNTMPFALAGFSEVVQEKPGVYRVKNFARNGQLLNQNVTKLPIVAASNAGVPASGGSNVAHHIGAIGAAQAAPK
ncbi:MAG: sulfatase-like hydrolase/transferase [Methyloceanibacter sp.]